MSILNSHIEKANRVAIKNLASKTAITLSHQFADITARDAYFVLNPTELVDNLFIKVGTGYQRYLSSIWEDVSSVNNYYGIYINAVTGGATRNFGIYNLASKNYSKGTEFIDGGNLILGAMTATVGAGGTNVLGITKGTAPAASIPDMVQIYSAILPNTKATLGLMFHEQVVGDVALASTHSLTVAINQRLYKIPLVDITPV